MRGSIGDPQIVAVMRWPGWQYARYCERSEAIHPDACRGMDCFASLTMTVRRAGTHFLSKYLLSVVGCGHTPSS
jgi:hypothetical protein